MPNPRRARDVIADQLHNAITPLHAQQEAGWILDALEAAGLVAVPREATASMSMAALNANRALPEPRPMAVGRESWAADVIWTAMVEAGEGAKG
jgi:hypothetical protein